MRSATVSSEVATARESSGREAPIRVVGTASPAKQSANTASGASTRPAMDRASQS